MNIGAFRQIKIIYVIGQLTMGGTERQLLELVSNLNSEKFKAIIVSLSGRDDPLVTAFQDAGCDVYLLERQTRSRFSVLLDLYRIFGKVRPDIAHAYAYASRAAIPIARLFPKCKIIVSIRTQPEWQIMLSDRILNSLADYLLTNSQKARSSLQSSFFRTIPCQVIYNGIDFAKFDFALHNEASFFPNQDGFVICAVARLQQVKGLDVLLKAFAQVACVFESVFLWLIGDGPELGNLKKLADDLGIGGLVTFWGEQPNVADFLRRADIGVLSSHIEGLPNAIIEYMAAALPIVATDVGGVSELIGHHENGLLVPANRPQVLADALITLLKDRELAQKLGQAGRVFVTRNFDVKNMIDATEAVYETLCPIS